MLKFTKMLLTKTGFVGITTDDTSIAYAFGNRMFKIALVTYL